MSQESDFRILLVGRTGHGKSSTGNTITGQDVFEVSGASKSKTKTCQWSNKCTRFGKVVEVVDTPGIFDTDRDQIQVHKELLKALALTTPGFHVIAFVLMKSKFTEEIQKTQDLFFNWFGKDVDKFACVILTDTDSEGDKNTYLTDDPHHKLVELVTTCDNNVIALNNKGSTESKDMQVRQLFRVIDDIKMKNGNKHFSNVFFKLVESYIQSRDPSELTAESIRLIEDAAVKKQLSQSQIYFLQKMYTGLESIDDNSQESKAGTDVDSIQTDRVDNDNVTRGNLQIYDNVSNKVLYDGQLCNQAVEKREMITSSDNAARSKSPDLGASGMADTKSFEVSGKNTDYYNVVQGRFGANDHSTYQIDYIETSAVMDGPAPQKVGDQNVEPEPIRNSGSDRRKNRVVDLESVRYDIPVQTRDDFKDRVNNGESGEEELHGLSGFFKKAWRYCKRKFDGCILL